MSRSPRHFYSFHAPDPILGIRVGVNCADVLNGTTALAGVRKGYFPPRGRIVKRACQIAAVAWHAGVQRNERPTLRLEHLSAAIRELTNGEDLATVMREIVVGRDEDTERDRGRIARTRYAATRAAKEQERADRRERRRQAALRRKQAAA